MPKVSTMWLLALFSHYRLGWSIHKRNLESLKICGSSTGSCHFIMFWYSLLESHWGKNKVNWKYRRINKTGISSKGFTWVRGVFFLFSSEIHPVYLRSFLNSIILFYRIGIFLFLSWGVIVADDSTTKGNWVLLVAPMKGL